MPKPSGTLQRPTVHPNVRHVCVITVIQADATTHPNGAVLERTDFIRGLGDSAKLDEPLHGEAIIRH